jgi:hypothetical protein
MIAFSTQHRYFHSSQLSHKGKSCFVSPCVVLTWSQTVNSISADYDKIAGFFEDLGSYLNQLKILERHIPLSPELEVAVSEVLTSVLVLCGICAKYARKKRIGMDSVSASFSSLLPWDVTLLC